MKKKFLLGMLGTALLLLTVGVTYSYFTGIVTGEGKKLTVTSTELKILFVDDSSLADSEIIPGWSESKSFSVKNESKEDFNYNIVFENLVNTFVTEGFLQYKITSTSGYNMEGYLDIPKSSSPQDVVLAYDIDIEVGATHEYTIEFVYHNSDTVDQSEDMGKEFNGNLAITEGSVDPNVKYTVTMSSDNGSISPSSDETIKNESLEFSVTPNEGYDISKMSVSCSPVANTTITGDVIRVNSITQNHDCTVSFDKKTYTVDIEVINGTSNALNKIVEHGGSAQTNITPNYGYTLEGASVTGTGCSISGDTLTISNVTSNGKCTVTLAKAKYQVTLTGEGIATSNSPQEAEYEGSTTINFTLTDGYELGSTSINCDNGAVPSISGNVLTVSNVTANTTCTLSPTLKNYDVTLVVNGGTGGSTKSVSHGGSTTFSIGANTGYNLTNASISCTGSASKSISGSVVTIGNVTASQTCTVTLNKNTYTVSVSSNNTSYGTVSPASSTVSHGNSLVITLTEKGGAKYKSNTCGGTVSGSKMTISNITASKSCTVTFEYKSGLLVDKVKTAYPPKVGRTDFSSIDNGTPGLYTGTDDQGTTYYFSGDGSSMNNWVSFAGKLWRIIRINGNGSVRLLYAGTGGTDGTIGMSAYNPSTSHPAHVGWRHSIGGSLEADRGNSVKSGAYVAVENWYTGLSNTDKNYVDTGAIYCNDRNIATGQSYDLKAGFDYAASERLNSTNKTPTFKCSNLNDRFYTFGLMTADELSFAGGVYGVQSPKAYYYLNASGGSSTGIDWWWTMTPYLALKDGWSSVFRTHGSKDSGTFGRYDVKDSQGTVRPVISIKSCVMATRGDGSASSPYELTISSTCSGYNVTASITNGYVSTSSNVKSVESGGKAEFLIQPNSGYGLKGATVSGTGCTFNESTGVLTATNVTSTRTCNVTLVRSTLADTIKTAYAPVSGRTNFSSIDNGTPKLYTGSDDQGTTYYFSGDGSSMNNWVSFAGKKWRIIRINGNGSVRLLYAGNGTSATDIGTSAFNSTRDHPQYVGWKYTEGNSLATNRGNGTKSTIYSKVETWYNGLSSTDKNYIDTGAIYCNDRNLASGSTYSTSSTFYYAAYGRLANSKTPTFNCSNTSDRFATFGLMTADEVAFAGGVWATNSPKAYYYLAQDGTSSITGTSWWWTMSPKDFGGYAYVFAVGGSSNPGNLGRGWVIDRNVVRPVVSLKSSVLVTGGSGTGSNPYTLTMQ